MANEDFKASIALVREQADSNAIVELLAAYPAGVDIGPRPPGSVSYADTVIGKLPRDGKKRRVRLEAELASCRASLRADVKRYDDLRRNGLRAISDSDLMIAYSGDALHACRCSLELKAAHISFHRSMVEALLRALEVDEADRAKSARAKPVKVKVTLSLQKAFVVKKWAAAINAKCTVIDAGDPQLVQVAAALPAHQAFVVRKWAIDGRSGMREGSPVSAPGRPGGADRRAEPVEPHEGRYEAQKRARRRRIERAQSIADAHGMALAKYSEEMWEKGAGHEAVELHTYSPRYTSKDKYAVKRFFEGKYTSGAFDSPELADLALKAATRTEFEAVPTETPKKTRKKAD
ncbi:hypothetical protein [Burkholderia aenigmatica]|uniref:hypothetical protein n=1 Tax=Burkholderia aenigmatica TaxID=2015348 RepID=UPI00264A66F4|nr:hypothetical protein [Burkholderia aenigmatica]MDN7880088.1 hypothetical protein [Burkholderia aenigmatica]